MSSRFGFEQIQVSGMRSGCQSRRHGESLCGFRQRKRSSRCDYDVCCIYLHLFRSFKMCFWNQNIFQQHTHENYHTCTVYISEIKYVISQTDGWEQRQQLIIIIISCSILLLLPVVVKHCCRIDNQKNIQNSQCPTFSMDPELCNMNVCFLRIPIPHISVFV